MFNDINSWFNNGCNYAEGISLYARYGSDLFFKIVLKKGETPLNRQRLSKELAELRDTEEAPAPAEVAPSSPAPEFLEKPELSEFRPQNVPAAPAANGQAETPALLQVIKERKQTNAEIQSLHPHLSILPEGEKLRELAAHLVRQTKHNYQLWDRYNYLTEGGVDEEPAAAPAPPPVLVDIHLLNKRESIRKSLNKAENRIKGVEKPHPNTLLLIADRRKQLEEIDARIAAIKKEGGI